MLKGKLLIAVLLAVPAAAQAGYSDSKDRDGCWDALDDGGSGCLSYDRDESGFSSNKKSFEAVYENTCDVRIYIKVCNKRRDGSDTSDGVWSCGSSGLNPGRTYAWRTYDATGDWTSKAIGSTRGSRDWVCAGKVDDWNDE